MDNKPNVKGVWSGNEAGWSENETSDPLGTLLASTRVKVQWSQVHTNVLGEMPDLNSIVL